MSLDVKFSATDSGFTSTVSKVKTSVKSMDDSVGKTATSVKTSFGSMVKAGAALAVGFGAIKLAANAIAGTFGTFKDALDLGGEMSDLSARTGETAGNLTLLRRAFDNSGVGAEAVGTSINKLQKFMDDASQGAKVNNDVLSRLGLTMADMAGKTPTEQMAMLAEKLSGVTDNGERSALAMSIFGRAGGQLLPLLTDFSDELKKAQDQLGSMPGVMDRSAEAFDAISDNITVAKGKFLEFAAGLLESLAPALELATTLITRFDAAGAGMKLGEIITGASNAMGGFTDALAAINLGEFGLAFKIAFESIKLQAADSINSIWANIQAMGGSVMAFFGEMFRPDGDLGHAIKDLFEYLGNTFAISISKAIMPVIRSIPRIGEVAANNIQQAIYRAELDAGLAAERMAGHFSYVPEQMIVGLDKAKEKYGEILSNGTKLIDTTKMEIDLQKTKLDVLDAQSKKQDEIAKKVQDEFNMMDDVRGKSFDLPFNMMDHLKNNLKVQKEITNELEKQLGLGAKILADAKAAQSKDRLDPGGRLEKAGGEAIAAGKFAAARRIGRQLESRERDQAFQEAFGKKEGGIGKSVKDIAKEQGIDTFGKTKRELQKELMEKRQAEMKPGAEGKKGDKPGDDPDPKPAENLLQKAVDAIKTAVEKLEKKLPMPALGV
jgi:hypothetical protein